MRESHMERVRVEVMEIEERRRVREEKQRLRDIEREKERKEKEALNVDDEEVENANANGNDVDDSYVIVTPPSPELDPFAAETTSRIAALSVVEAASFTETQSEASPLNEKFTVGGRRNSLLLMVGVGGGSMDGNSVNSTSTINEKIEKEGGS